MIPKVTLLGDRGEAERLRGFALSQLRILLDTMKFQELKQYTRIVRFSDGSFVRAFSSFGINTVTVFVPPVSVPEREVVKIEEAVYIAPEPCEIELEILGSSVTTCTWQWVFYCGAGNPVGEPETWHITTIGNNRFTVDCQGAGETHCKSCNEFTICPGDPEAGGCDDELSYIAYLKVEKWQCV